MLQLNKLLLTFDGGNAGSRLCWAGSNSCLQSPVGTARKKSSSSLQISQKKIWFNIFTLSSNIIYQLLGTVYIVTCVKHGMKACEYMVNGN